MCAIVTIDGKKYSSPRELIAVCNVLSLSRGMINTAPQLAMDCCLCPIDLETTADENGFDYEEVNEDWMDVVFTKRTTAPTPPRPTPEPSR